MGRLIDAEALVHDLIHNRSFYPVCVRRAIEDAPAIDAKPVVHSLWVGGRFRLIDGVYEERCLRCSEWSDEYDKPYCPNCGAKMDGGKDT